MSKNEKLGLVMLLLGMFFLPQFPSQISWIPLIFAMFGIAIFLYEKQK